LETNDLWMARRRSRGSGRAIGSYITNKVITESSLEYNYRSTPLLISFFNELVANLFDSKERTELRNLRMKLKLLTA